MVTPEGAGNVHDSGAVKVLIRFAVFVAVARGTGDLGVMTFEAASTLSSASFRRGRF